MRNTPSPRPDDDLYDVAAKPKPPVQTAKAVGTAPLNYRAPAQTASDAYFPDKIKDFQMPIALIAIGVVVEFLSEWWTLSHLGFGPGTAMIRVGAEVIINTVLILAAILIAAKLRGIEFRPFASAILKLAAISIAPSAAMTFLGIFLYPIPLGFIIVWVATFCFYFALIGVFFDLDQSDTWYCVIVIFLVKLAVALAIAHFT